MKRKKGFLIYLLVLSLILTATTSAYAEVVDKKEHTSKTKEKPTESFARQHKVTKEFLQKEMNRGYTLNEIGAALQISKSEKKSYKDTIEKIKAEQKNDSQKKESTVISDPELERKSFEPKLEMALAGQPSSPQPPELGEQINEAPYTVPLGNDNISTLSGGLTLNSTDMVLTGRNGFNFALERSYSSQEAQLYDTDVGSTNVNEYGYRVAFDVKTQREALGYKLTWTEISDIQEDRDGNGTADYTAGIVVSSTNKTGTTTYYTNSEITTAISTQANAVRYGPWNTSGGLPYWRYIYTTVNNSVGRVSANTTRSIGSPTYSTLTSGIYSTYTEAQSASNTIKNNNGNIFSYSSWGGDSTYMSVREVTYFNDTTPEIQSVVIGSYTDYYNRTVKKYTETLYPIGTGWSWKIPSIETKNGKKYVHLADGGTYEISGISLKGYPWKNISYATDTSVVVNGVTSTSVVRNETSKTRQYFSSDGRLIKIVDANENYVQFIYSTSATYGKVLSRIENSLGNSINIAYSTQDVRISQGDRTVVYTKQVSSTANNKELLTSVTDVAGRRTTYDYAVKAAKFNLLGTTPNTSNPFALITGVTHPTGAKTNYQYELNVTKRFLAASAVTETYRLASAADQLLLSNGSIENKNIKTISYVGDMGSSFNTDMNFSVAIQNNGVISKFDQKKDYIDAATGSVYYNTKVTQTVGDEQRTVEKSYDETRRLPIPSTLISTTAKNGQVSDAVTIQKTYDEYGNLLTETDPLGTRKSYVYNTTTHLLTSVTEPVSPTSSLTSSFLHDAKGNVTQYRVTDQSNTVLREENYEYDGYGNRTSTRIKNGNDQTTEKTTYGTQYNSAFPTRRTILQNGSEIVVEEFEYDPLSGNLTKHIDANGNVTSFQYDKLDRLINQEHADLTQRTATYNDIQNYAEVTDELGHVTFTQWNQLGWKTEQGIISNGIREYKTKLGYDDYGNQIWTEDALGRRTTATYDTWNRVLETAHADQSKIKNLYDDVARIRKTIDEDGTTTQIHLDKLGREVREELVKSAETQVLKKNSYNYAGDLIRSEDGNGNASEYSYNSLRELTAVKDPEGKATQYLYDMRGNRIRTIYPDNKVEENKYDAINRLIEKKDAEGQIERYSYDGNGNLIQKTDRKGQVQTYSYNNRNLLIEKRSGGESVTYSYDPAGKRSQMTDSTGTTVYGYNELWQLSSVQTPDGKTIAYEYDVLGNREKMIDPFGQEINYVRDIRNRLESVTLQGESTPEVTYSYTPSGQLKSEAQRNGMLSEMNYGENKRLTTLTQKYHLGTVLNTYSYQYDVAGHQTQKTENFDTYHSGYDTNGRIKQNSQFNETYLYDSRGNRDSMTSEREQEVQAADYEYDVWNRLVKVTMESGKTVDYIYNGDGLLYERKENGKVTRYYYDEEQVIAEADVTEEGASLKTRYIRGNSLIAQSDSQGVMTYYLHNGHGDVTEIRGSTGALLNKYTYDIWGNPLSKTEKVSNPFRYSGEMWDETTELQYLRARWYDPKQGRFLTEDTLEGKLTEPLTQNLYAYSANNPISYVDPSGHAYTWALRSIAKTYIKGGFNSTEASLAVFFANGLTYFAPDLTDGYDKGEPAFNALFLSFHEIAQIHVAKKLYQVYGEIPVLEESISATVNGKKKRYEADVVLGSKVWEIKPSGGKQDPKVQLELYRKYGGYQLGSKLSPITNITVLDNIKMDITFPEAGVARYELYIQENGVRKILTTIGAAVTIGGFLLKLTPGGRRLGPAY
ncbi:RHS repeat-associated core domain-containing protein [Tumebacillus lipolyticus]|uniref:RHS repeat-associated core domain-containing protein n=1 Tax=Tumebacillus lipolyticus TaxID=1280370 RepID=A0ABW4ZX15_9BACL